MLQKFEGAICSVKDKKWLIAAIAAGIAVAAAAISAIVYFSKQDDAAEEDCFID